MNHAILMAALPMVLFVSGCDAALESFNAVGRSVEREDARQAGGEAMSPAQAAFAEANARMHAGMGRIDADADIAFMQGMIPHHQGAIDMANIVLEHGDDPQAKALARRVIAAQGAEIAEIRAWLARRGRGAGDAPAADHGAMGH